MPYGTTPPNGFSAVDGLWLNALAGGHNLTYQSGIVATGTNQATSLQLLDFISTFEVDTTAASTGVALPAAIQGMEIAVYNNGASTLTVFPKIANNPLTGAQDTINNATSVTLATHVGATYRCAKNGIWFAC